MVELVNLPRVSESFGKYMSRNMDFGFTMYYRKERKIGGKEFTTTWYDMNRKSADRRAYNLRRCGWYARVILARIMNNGTKRYEVYYRSKEVEK